MSALRRFFTRGTRPPLPPSTELRGGEETSQSSIYPEPIAPIPNPAFKSKILLIIVVLGFLAVMILGMAKVFPDPKHEPVDPEVSTTPSMTAPFTIAPTIPSTVTVTVSVPTVPTTASAAPAPAIEKRKGGGGRGGGGGGSRSGSKPKPGGAVVVSAGQKRAVNPLSPVFAFFRGV
ncbi:hypothetical protein KVT40_005817 [Elsinoe batatas]|uniref:Uncharacterized protein n=1 Tax=Elsinoe batatas TaxID=2601811 RepID=A0A8K0L0K8_9PEZI|nr:hypothetical protein KVT40_005817 [Elsinoe batatas]